MPSLARSSKDKVLIVSMDENNLMAKLVAWWVVESGVNAVLVEGLAQRQELEVLQEGLMVIKTVIVAERITEQGIKRWLDGSAIDAATTWVGSGAWLYAEHQGLTTEGVIFSDVEELVQSEFLRFIRL